MASSGEAEVKEIGFIQGCRAYQGLGLGLGFRHFKILPNYNAYT